MKPKRPSPILILGERARRWPLHASARALAAWLARPRLPATRRGRAALACVLGLPLAAALVDHRTGGLALTDWGFQDADRGSGWQQRCAAHVESRSPRSAEAACRRGLAISRGADVRAELLRLMGLAAEQRGRIDDALSALGASALTLRTDATDAAIARLCAARPLPSLPGLESVKLAAPPLDDAPGGLAIRVGPASTDPSSFALPIATCVRVGEPRAEPAAGGSIWYRIAAQTPGGAVQGWLPAASLAPRDPAAAWLGRCQSSLARGEAAEAALLCAAGLDSPALDLDARASLEHALGLAQAHLGQAEAALEQLVSSYQHRRDDAVAAELDAQCASLRSPPRAPGDGRRYRVVSWAAGDRAGKLRNEPSTTSRTTRVLTSLRRPTCVLAGEHASAVGADGQPERWYFVEAISNGKAIQGWMSDAVLDPK
jgi:tetratricopeptide (TPR) repeat protein